MAYVHQSSPLTTVGFQAWDGEDYSKVYDLKIQVKNKTKTEKLKCFDLRRVNLIQSSICSQFNAVRGPMELKRIFHFQIISTAALIVGLAWPGQD